MLRYIVIMVIACCVGYALGFQDAKQNEKDIVTRWVERVGGGTRDQLKTDVDATMSGVDADTAPHKK